MVFSEWKGSSGGCIIHGIKVETRRYTVGFIKYIVEVYLPEIAPSDDNPREIVTKRKINFKKKKKALPISSVL